MLSENFNKQRAVGGSETGVREGQVGRGEERVERGSKAKMAPTRIPDMHGAAQERERVPRA